MLFLNKYINSKSHAQCTHECKRVLVYKWNIIPFFFNAASFVVVNKRCSLHAANRGVARIFKMGGTKLKLAPPP